MKTCNPAAINKTTYDEKNFTIEVIKNVPKFYFLKICAETDFVRNDFICTEIYTCVTHRNWWSFVRKSKFKSKRTFCC